jgi:uncharacterized membrane protein YkoI
MMLDPVLERRTMMPISKKRLALLGSGLLGATLAFAADLPPQGSKSAADVAKIVENLGVGTVTDLEFDDGRWEAKVYNQAKAERTVVHVDALTGEVKHQKVRAKAKEEVPPTGSKALSDVLHDAKNVGTVVDVEFDHGRWEVEHFLNGQKKKLELDPKTGEPSP